MALGPKSQRDQIMVVVAILAFVVLGAYWYYVYSPKDVQLSALEERVEALDAANQRAKAELAKGSVDDLRAEAQRLAKDLERMRLLVPTSNEVPSLLEQVSTAARRVGLDLAAVEPEPVIEGEVFDTYRYRVTVLGSYHAVGEFLTNVGSLTRIIAPVNLGLSPLANQQASTARRKPNESVLDSRFHIQTYVAKTAAPPAKKAERTPGGSKS